MLPGILPVPKGTAAILPLIPEAKTAPKRRIFLEGGVLTGLQQIGGPEMAI